MAAYGAEDRALLESVATGLYDEVVAAGGIADADPRVAVGSPSRAAFELLCELGLLTLDHDGLTWLPEDPSRVQSQVVTPLSAEGSRLLTESSQWAQAFGTLAQSWRRAPQAEGRGPFTYLRDYAIESFIGGLVAEAEEEMLTAQPQTGRDAPSVAVASPRDIALLERGASLRTLYQHSARRSAYTRSWVAEVTPLGAEVRTLDEFFQRMIIVDRRVAVIPAGDDFRRAVAIREPSVVAFLVDLFERSWARGRPFTSRDATVLKDIAAEQRAMTVRMLIEGHSDPVAAKRLGVSPRTYAGYVADLKADYDAETRFQLGYVMGTSGVSGSERDET